jgi:hypothetical protein
MGFSTRSSRRPGRLHHRVKAVPVRSAKTLTSAPETPDHPQLPPPSRIVAPA